jgi:hypothetical protein
MRPVVCPAHLAILVARVFKPVQKTLLMDILDATRALARIEQLVVWAATTATDPAAVSVILFI